MNKTTLKSIILEQADAVQNTDLGTSREKIHEIKPFCGLPHTIVIAGMRRVGKSTLLMQLMKKFYANQCYYFSFEDERLIHFGQNDFNILYEIFIEFFDEKKVFFLDEIQNVNGWENFVRRMQDAGHKFFISGSNASLLSGELGTKLTGRHISVNLYPFSFQEFLLFNDQHISKHSTYKTGERVKIIRWFSQYLQDGGMPEYLKYKNKEVLRSVYEDILYRDIVARYEIKEIAALRELALFYISNIGSFVSFNKMKSLLKLGSTNTVKVYTDYLENSFLFFTLKRYSYSLKQQYIAAKKIYCIDNGFAKSIAFVFSENEGHFLENLVFIELKRRGKDIFYYKTINDLEIDFVVVEGKKPKKLIQVCWEFHKEDTRKRELKAMAAGLKELHLQKGLILTNEHEEDIRWKGYFIRILPVWKWLLTGREYKK